MLTRRLAVGRHPGGTDRGLCRGSEACERTNRILTNAARGARRKTSKTSRKVTSWRSPGNRIAGTARALLL